MEIIFQNNTRIPIILVPSKFTDAIIQIYKHLQHIDLPFKPWDSSFYLDRSSYQDLVRNLSMFAQKIGINVNQQWCFEKNQKYFNELHQIYESSYDGNQQWLDYHEHIHLCELYPDNNRKKKRYLNLDYREKSGLLEKHFDISWLETSVTDLDVGDVYVSWAELGKSPYVYWENNEPNDIKRICQLAKPWLKLRPKLSITFEKNDRLSEKNINEFNNWWRDYHDEWCNHWKIPCWGIKEMFSCMVVGKINDIESLQNLLTKDIHPVRVKL